LLRATIAFFTIIESHISNLEDPESVNESVNNPLNHNFWAKVLVLHTWFVKSRVS